MGLLTHDEFVTKWKGRYLDHDGKFGFQCLDLFRQYLVEVCGIPAYGSFPGVGYAKQLWNYSPSKFQKIKNTPTNVPQKGDIVIWQGWYPFVTGIAGHVAIFDQGDVNTFISFDQNLPTNSPCHLQKHSYRGVLGWFHKV